MSLQLLGPAQFEATIKRSRFVAHAGPVQSEADTLAFFERVADPAATHNCWAWRLDLRYRFNDDGEPSGTAGRPLLAVLEGRDLDGVMVVVTRYYGGIKLGVGGLVRAYSGTAARCLDQARTAPRVRWLACELVADFSLVDPLHQLLERHGAAKRDERFDERGVTLDVRVPQDRLEAMKSELEDISRGQARLWLKR